MRATPIGFSSQQNFGAVGAQFGARTATAVGINTSVVLDRGWNLVENAADTVVRFTYNSGSNFVTILGNSAVGFVWSDGFNVELRGGASGGTAQVSTVLGAS